MDVGVTPRLLIAAMTAVIVMWPGDARVTVHLAGDSTMAEKLPQRRPETGWGEMLPGFFDTTAVRFVNHARNGRSTRTFISEGRWKTIVDSLAPGDFVFIQFGHNDAARDRPDRSTSPAEYSANLRRFVLETRRRDAIPVLLTPVVRRRFNADGEFYDTHREYPDLVRSLARELNVPLIDMQRSSERVLRLFGPVESARLYLHLAAGTDDNYPAGLEDNTHFSPFGARVMAFLAVEGIRDARLEPLSTHLRGTVGNARQSAFPSIPGTPSLK